VFKRNRKLENFGVHQEGEFIKPASRTGGGFKRGMNPSPASRRRSTNP
jgi:hypothetical protein